MPGISLRVDYNAAGLRTHARRASCPRQVRRLLELAAVYEGRSRTEGKRLVNPPCRRSIMGDNVR